MTRNELSEKFLKLANEFTNLYRNSDLDITDEQYNKLLDWMKYNAEYLAHAPIFFSEAALKGYENDYENMKKDIYTKYWNN